MTISIVPVQEGAPAGYDLDVKLLSREGWNLESELPGPRNFYGMYFRVLTDAWPLNFQIKPGRREHFREDLAQALGAGICRLSIKSSHPRIIDVCSFGLWTSSLLVATEQLIRIPCPPARRRETQIIVILDMRRILKGISWRLIEQGQVRLRSIRDSFWPMSPLGHEVVVRSASTEGPVDLDATICTHGQVLEVLFVPQAGFAPLPPADDPPAGPDERGHTGQRHQSANDRPPTLGPSAGAPHGRGSGHARSRSPRQGGPAGRDCPNVGEPAQDQANSEAVGGRATHPAASPRTETGNLIDHAAPSNSLQTGENSPMKDVADTRLPSHLKLLQDPEVTGSPADTQLQGALEASRLLGTEWPRAPYRWQPNEGVEPDDESLEDELDNHLLVDATFCLLTPGYTPERLDLTVLMPQSIAEVADLLHTCRDITRKDLFPDLLEVRPQPNIGWGVFLALPNWLQQGIVICLDLTALDGRIFAERTPQFVDLQTLLALADLANDAEFDVHVPDHHGPLQHGVECELYPGCCVSFTPRDMQPIARDLLRMLRTPEEWSTGPGVTQESVEGCYCVAAPDKYFIFRLLSGRSVHYKQDLAQATDIHVSRLQLVPATASPGDITIAGWQCRTAVAAVRSQVSVSWHQTPVHYTVGLLDARPALLGWMPLYTQHAWLDLQSLAEGLNQSAPTGWQIVFPAFPKHWTWIWFTSGQILIAAFEPVPVETAEDATPARQSDYTGEAHEGGDDDDDHPNDTSEPGTFQSLVSSRPHADAPADGTRPHPPGLSVQKSPSMADLPVSTGMSLLFLAVLFLLPLLRAHGLPCLFVHRGELTAIATVIMPIFPLSPGQTESLLVAFYLSGSPHLQLAFWLVGFIWASRQPWNNAAQLSAGTSWPQIRLSWHLKLLLGVLCCMQLLPGAVASPTDKPEIRRGPLDARRPIPTPARSRLPTLFDASLPPGPCTVPAVPPAAARAPFERVPTGNYKGASQPDVGYAPARIIDPPSATPGSAHLGRFGIVTLLEESKSQPDCDAFFLAATLLETLMEHFEVKDVAVKVPEPKCQLSLSAHVPPPTFQLDQDCVRLPHQPGLIGRLLQGWPANWVLPDRWDINGVPPSTKQALNGTDSWHSALQSAPSPRMAFSLYTDGSASIVHQHSGYSVVILLHTATATALFGILGGGLQGHAASPWPTDGPSALHAENVAIAVALLWIVQLKEILPKVDSTIRFDCMAAGWAAEGTWRPTGPMSELVHHLSMFAQATPGVTVSYAHVKGHSGDPWNDLADFVAKTASSQQHTWPAPPSDLCQAICQQDISWLAPEQDARVHHAIPCLDGTLVWSPPSPGADPIPGEALIPTTSANAKAATDHATFQANFATINVQSLNKKCQYIEEQLHARCINVACLQETKLPGGTLTSKHYLRLHTHADSHWGVAVWIHRTLGLCRAGEAVLTADEHDVAILHEDPRLMALLVTIGEVKVGILSGHCPHTQRADERDVFLKILGPLLQRVKHANLVIGGFDLNGRVPVSFSDVSGSLEFGDPDEAGWRFASLLSEGGMWIPSMYPQIHCGDSATYTHPNGQQHRIDYVFIGGQAVVEKARSEVDESFDNGSPQEDHKLLTLSLQGILDASGQHSRLRRTKYDRDKILTQAGRDRIGQVLASFPQPSWATDVDHHCKHFEDFIRRELDEHFAIPAAPARATYIPEEVWRLRDSKVNFKCRVRHRAKLWQDLLVRAFAQWKEGQDYSVPLLLRKQGLLYEIAAAAVKLSTAAIRRQILRAKHAFLQQVAGEGHHGASKVLQRVKKAGMGGAKTRPISRPLPMLLHPDDGTAIATRKQRDQVWMLHFGKQEQGSATPIDAFLAEAQWSCYDSGVSWDIGYLPSYLDIEQVLHDIPRNKAAGLDNIPGEVLKAAPAAAARALLPLFVKSMLTQHQPVQWRGGVLFEAFKRSGLQSSVDSYRSLFVSSYVAKTYHRVVRNKAQQYSRDELHPLHLGSKKRAPVTFAALFVLSHLRRCHTQRRSASVLYLDTSAAYYRIVRELAVGDIRADDTVLRLFHRFGLSGDDVQELLETVRAGGMMAEAGAPEALQQVVKDIHLHTWFVTRFSDGTEVCSSLAGSRPGESWADLIYAYIYGRVLHKVHEHARAEELSFSAAFEPEAGPFATAPGSQPLSVTDATWADDSAFPLEDESAERLLHKTRRLCTLVLNFCEGHGMAPNLKPGKTSIMLYLTGRGSQRARKSFFEGGKQSLYLPDLGVNVVVADSYKHLGGMLDSKLSMRPEARFRLAQAASSYDTARALLLGNPRLELATRSALFESVVTPTFFNLGMWLPHGKAWESMSLGYSKLIRRLLVPIVGAQRAFHLPLPVAHWCTGCWHLDLVARRARFSLLLSLASVGPPLLWAMLQEEGQWCKVLQDDLRWLVAPDPSQWPATQATAWPHWCCMLSSSQARFRRQLRKRLQQEHSQQCHKDAGLLCQWHCYRTLMARQPSDEPVTRWICHSCSKSFRNKAALGVHFFKVHGRGCGIPSCC